MSDSPSPSMFIAPREAKCSRPRCSLEGHEVFSQRQTASSSSRCSRVWQSGHVSGICHGTESGGRRLSTGPTTRGITSPAFSMITVSPSRMSLRAMSSELCSVAMEIVEPATNTGSSTANGVTAPGAADVDVDLRRRGRLLFGGELERHRPARKLARGAERLAPLDVVHLHHDAVGLEVERAPLFGPRDAERDHLVDPAAAAPVRFHRQAPRPQERERVGVRRRDLRRDELIGERAQPPLRHQFRIEIAQHAGGGVAGVGEQRFALGLALRVRPLERALGQIHLAAHFEPRRGAAAEIERDRADGAHVVRHDFPGDAVAASGRPRQASLLVGERDAEAVDLQLGDVLDGVGAERVAQTALHAIVERPQVLFRVRVVEAEHRLEVHRVLEPGRHASAHALRRRLRRDQFGMSGFERAQLVHQRVVLAVGDLGLVQDPVALVVVANQAPQLLDALGWLGLGTHGRGGGAPRSAVA